MGYKRLFFFLHRVPCNHPNPQISFAFACAFASFAGGVLAFEMDDALYVCLSLWSDLWHFRRIDAKQNGQAQQEPSFSVSFLAQMMKHDRTRRGSGSSLCVGFCDLLSDSCF
ncbi:hypothetical protein O6H91_04G138600 [Diphasiastrum complanatum]|uniref:Uncharacterized protein n=1 Tax=Diphasiastrum complanatum TaxID=34168 RepID=A0ACC2E2D7_DIPCM|nr:hypothetical protein O6H91_04G138600 [Diphasiastrum complanatum]